MVNAQQPQGSAEGSLGTPVKLPADKDAFTRDEVVQIMHRQRSEYFRDNVSPLKKANESLTTQVSQLQASVTDATSRLKELEADRERAEESAAKGNPDALKTIQDRREAARLREQIKSEKQALDNDRARLQDTITKGQAYDRLMKVGEVAQKYGLEPSKLAPLAAHITTDEGLETLAQTLAASSAPVAGGIKGDSGISVGTTGPITPDAVEKMDLGSLARMLYPKSVSR